MNIRLIFMNIRLIFMNMKMISFPYIHEYKPYIHEYKFYEYNMVGPYHSTLLNSSLKKLNLSLNWTLEEAVHSRKPDSRVLTYHPSTLFHIKAWFTNRIAVDREAFFCYNITALFLQHKLIKQPPSWGNGVLKSANRMNHQTETGRCSKLWTEFTVDITLW